MRTLRTALAVAVLAALAPATPAFALHVSVEDGEIVIVDGERNSAIAVAERAGDEPGTTEYEIRDDLPGMDVGEGCKPQENGPPGAVCSRPDEQPAIRIRADMGPGADGVRVEPATRTPIVLAGGEGADWMAGGAGADRFDGGPGNDFMWGDEGPSGPAVERAPDEFAGGEGTDRVSYTGHQAAQIRVTLDDRADDGAPLEADNVHSDVEDVQGDPGAENALYGTDAANFLWGGQKRDLIVGGGGADRLMGDRGDDQIEARDGVADSIDCGEGADRAVVDAADGLEPGCEAVDAPAPGPGPGPEPGSGGPPQPVPPLHGTFPVSFPQRTLKPSKRGRLVVRVRCGDVAGCTGSLDVRTVKKVRVGRRWQSFALGQRAFSVAGGETARLGFRLSKRQRSALRRVRKVRLLAHAVEVRPNQRDWTGALTLRRR